MRIERPTKYTSRRWNGERLKTVEQVAKDLNLSLSAIYSRIYQRKIAASKIKGHWYIHVDLWGEPIFRP